MGSGMSAICKSADQRDERVEGQELPSRFIRRFVTASL
jgi:hypothetical protein